MMNDIPDSLPKDFETPPDVTPIKIGMDPKRGLVLIRVGDSPMTGLPVAVALQLGHNISAKALTLLLAPPAPEPEDEGPRLVLPG